MSRGTRLAFLGAALVVVIVAIVITTSGDGGESSDGNGQPGQGAETGPTGSTQQSKPKRVKPKVTQIRVVNGEPAGGIEKIRVDQGDRVRFAVASDVADEVHVHGYDHIKDVAAGGRVKFNFKATITGRFEIELEHREEQIASLRVDP